MGESTEAALLNAACMIARPLLSRAAYLSMPTCWKVRLKSHLVALRRSTRQSLPHGTAERVQQAPPKLLQGSRSPRGIRRPRRAPLEAQAIMPRRQRPRGRRFWRRTRRCMGCLETTSLRGIGSLRGSGGCGGAGCTTGRCRRGMQVMRTKVEKLRTRVLNGKKVHAV